MRSWDSIFGFEICLQAGEPDQELTEQAQSAERVSKAGESKGDLTSRSRQQAEDHQEGKDSVSSGSTQTTSNDTDSLVGDTADTDFVKSLVHDIMTKAAAEAKGASAETKEAEKLAASAAKSPKPKDEVALKKGTTGKSPGCPSVV